MSSGGEVDRPTRGVAWMDWAVRLCVLGAGLAVAGGMLGGVLVQGGHVMPGWFAGAVLLVAAAILAIIRALLRRHAPGHAQRAQGRRRAWRVAATLVIAVAAAAGLVDDLTATYTVLAPTGPGGCQLAVREHSFLFSSGGEVYVAGVGGLGASAGAWTADDGAQPAASGSYTVQWDGTVALLSLSSELGNPVWPAVHAVSCP